MSQMLRLEIPVDDVWHPWNVSGPVVHVACRGMTCVEFWVLTLDGPADTRWFRAFPDGREVQIGRASCRVRV